MRLRKVDARELLRRAKDYLAQAPERRAGLTQAARAVGASVSSLAAAFRTLEKTSFYRYALNLRLARAAALLPTYDSLTELAYDFGFASHSHFSTAFHRWAGCTPSDYRADASSNCNGAAAAQALAAPEAGRASLVSSSRVRSGGAGASARAARRHAPLEFDPPAEGTKRLSDAGRLRDSILNTNDSH
jgi:AraC-like DNA-binding protein